MECYILVLFHGPVHNNVELKTTQAFFKSFSKCRPIAAGKQNAALPPSSVHLNYLHSSMKVSGILFTVPKALEKEIKSKISVPVTLNSGTTSLVENSLVPISDTFQNLGK